jgi:hypothetical protein
VIGVWLVTVEDDVCTEGVFTLLTGSQEDDLRSSSLWCKCVSTLAGLLNSGGAEFGQIARSWVVPLAVLRVLGVK